MRKFKLIIGGISIIGITLKAFHIPGGGAMLSIFLGILAMFYYLLSFALFNNIKLKKIFEKSAYSETNAKRIIGSIGIGIGLSTLIMGGLFKIQLFPGAKPQLFAGLLVCSTAFAISIIFYLKNKSMFFKGILTRLIIFIPMGFALYFIPSTSLVNYYYQDYHEYASVKSSIL